MKPYHLAVVGTGAIGRMHVQTAAQLESARLVAVCDERPEALEAVTRDTPARAYASYRELVAGERLDGVILCTPPSLHPEMATFFLESGIDVLCEKPLATTSAAAHAMYAVARRRGRLLALASKFRYVDDVEAARRLVRDGSVGRVRHAEITFISNVDMRNRWNADPAISGGGVIIDNGCHAADLCRYLFGAVSHVAAVAYRRTEGLDVEDSAYLYLGTEGGVGVTVDLSWSLDRQLPYYVRIFGEHGRLTIGWRESTLTHGGAGQSLAIGSGYVKGTAFAALQTDFVEASRGTRRARIDAADALASVEVVDAAYASTRNGGRVIVEPAEELAG